MTRFASRLFPHSRSLVGMVHVGALPGTPGARRSVDEIVEQAVAEARVLARAGFDGVIVENMHDVPYVHGVQGPEITAAMTRVALGVREVIGKMPLGVQVLSGGNKEALAVCLGSGGAFIRCENFVFAHVADEGLLERAEAGALLRYRRAIGAERVQVWCDVKKKHASHAITADVSIGEAAEAAVFFGADGLIVTGTATGKAATLEDVEAVRRARDSGSKWVPVVVGSGGTAENAGQLFEHADVLIVGSFIKRGGRWTQPVDPKRCSAMVRAVNRIRK